MKELEKISYSKLSTFEQCPRKFLYKYEQKKRSDSTSLALQIGTIAHYGMELIGQALIEGQKPDYEHIKKVVMEGYDEQDISRAVDENGEPLPLQEQETKTVHIPGVTELKEKYFFEWVEPDNKSGMNYDEKLKIYFDNLHKLEQDNEWRPVAVEPEFDFPHEGLFRLFGFIDRVDVNKKGEYRVVDYKSSKKLFDDKDTKTPMQMYFYTLAVEEMYGATPIEHIYDFIFLGQLQHSCSKGYQTRGAKKLMKLWETLTECRQSEVWAPKPTPLCFYCDYCKTNPNASNDFKEECTYYSLWTPHNKTFEKNKEFVATKTEAAAEQKPSGFWF